MGKEVLSLKKKEKSQRSFHSLKWSVIVLVLITLFNMKQVVCLSNGLARTPPMGWNSWNCFRCDINEHLVKNIALAMAHNGMKEAGYLYVNIDDCWMGKERKNGKLVPDAEAFPSGIKVIADYVHSLGLKLGIYEDAGEQTCQQRPGSFGYYQEDANTFASWDIDYLKFDFCYVPESKYNPRVLYGQMRDALNATGRSILFSICDGDPDDKSWIWGNSTGNIWRTGNDVEDKWDSIMRIIDHQANLFPYASPGGFNDADMLEGNGGLNMVEFRTQFSMWVIMASPLITGNNLLTMSPEMLQILLNKEAISINQDPLGLQGRRVITHDGNNTEVWLKPMQVHGTVAMAMLNRSNKTQQVEFDCITAYETLKRQDQEWTGPEYAKLHWIEVRKLLLNHCDQMLIRDLWLHKDIGYFQREFSSMVQPHETLLFSVKLTLL